MARDYILKPDFQIAKIFSDKTRQKIIELLSVKEMTNSQLSHELKLSKPTLSHHLKILMNNDIVKVSKVVNESHGIMMKYYKLNSELLLSPNKVLISKEKKKEFFKTVESENIRLELGDYIPLVFLRLLRYSIIESGLEFDKPMYNTGYSIGKNVFSKKIKSYKLDSVLYEISEIWKKLKLGNIEIINKNLIRVWECYQCQKMPDIGKPLCSIDEGIIAGILDIVLQSSFSVKEIKCWGTGYNYCEFEICVKHEP